MTDLLSQLQHATEGSRGLSDSVLIELGWTFKQWEQRRKKVPYDWITPDGQGVVEYGKQPDPSRDLQDAVLLVPEGYLWQISLNETDGSAQITAESEKDDQFEVAATPCLALCIAIIKAHEARSEAA